MSILRSYIDKNNTIISNSYVNTGRNPVIELNFGASDLIVPNFGYTRFIFDLDLSLLRQNIQSILTELNDAVNKILSKNIRLN